MNALLLALAAGGVLATAAAVSATLRLGSPVSFVLATYLLAAAEVVGLGLALSPLRLVDRAGLLVAEAPLLVLAAAVWLRGGAARPSLPHLELSAIRRHVALAVLTASVALSFAYTLFLSLAVPPNNSDSLTYRLSRAAAWLQHGGLHWITGAHTERQNEFPPNAELEQLYTLVFLRGDGAAALTQWLAAAALVVAVAGLARQLGYSRAASAFGGLLFATFAEIALQSSSTQNDLVTASFVAAAAYFVRSHAPAGVALAGLGIGLALGTKVSAWLALPVLGLLALASLPPRRFALATGAAIAATVLFAGPYLGLNLAHTGRPFGEANEQEIFDPDVTFDGTVSTVARITYRFVDLSGFRAGEGLRQHVERGAEDVFQALHIDPNPAESSGFPFAFALNVRSHEDHSFFGPLGILLLVPLSLAFPAAWALRRTTAAHAVHGAALPLFVLVLALAFRFSDEARYLIVPVALTAPLAAVVYRVRALVAAIVLIGVASLALTHARNELKPTGLGERTAAWQLPRLEAVSLDVPTRAPLLEAVEQHVPARARLGVVLGPSDWDAPLYGRHFERRLIPLPDEDGLAEAGRLGLDAVVFGSAWQPARDGWTIRRYRSAGTLAIRE